MYGSKQSKAQRPARGERQQQEEQIVESALRTGVEQDERREGRREGRKEVTVRTLVMIDRYTSQLHYERKTTFSQ